MYVGDGGMYADSHFPHIYTPQGVIPSIICPQQQELIIEARQMCSRFVSNGRRGVCVCVLCLCEKAVDCLCVLLDVVLDCTCACQAFLLYSKSHDNTA